MELHTLLEQFCVQMCEFTDTPFHIYPQEDCQQPRIRSWVEQIEIDEDFALIHLNYSEKKHMESYAAEVHIVEDNSDEYTVSVRVLWNGEAAKSAFKIADDEVDYISDFESEEDRKSRCCMPNDVYSESLSTEQKNAVDNLMETIRFCLSHIIGEEDE